MPYPVSNNVFVNLLFLTSLGLADVLVNLPTPTNLRINSVNMGLVLEWNGPENQSVNMTYRAEYRQLISGFKVVCFNTTAHSCDFTPELNALGVYVFRVRAEQDSDTSPWAKTEEFVMDKHTKLGPPSVKLVSTGTEMEVNIRDPVFRISKFSEIFQHATFNITYWKEYQEEKAQSVNDAKHKVVLELEPLSRYCFRVVVLTQRFFKQSQPSNVTCEATAKGQGFLPPWLLALGVFVSIAVVVSGLVLGAWHSYRLLSLGPKPQLPEHFTQDVLDQRDSPFLAMHRSPQPKEVYHEVSIWSVEGETEGELPLLDKAERTDDTRRGCV